MKALQQSLEKLKTQVERTMEILHFPALQTQAADLATKMNATDFWQDAERAKQVSRTYDELQQEIQTWLQLRTEIQEGLDLLVLAQDDPEAQSGLEKELEHKVAELEKHFQELELFVLLHDQYDQRGAIVAVHSGAGGVDAQDWASMLYRMFLRFCEKKGWRVEILEQSSGQEAGLKRAVFQVFGRHAYGFLQSEHGVHRLVRISPFDAEGMRHTSFALVEVLPEFAEVDNVELKEEDLRIDFFRSGGAGGQHVNKTDSAVRIVHIPTNITVVCQNERSQIQNKTKALQYLKAKLLKLRQDQRLTEMQKIRGEVTSAEWGSQIRSYVLHPYKLVKDHRTKYEEKNPDAVLNGELMNFMEAYLRWKREQLKADITA